MIFGRRGNQADRDAAIALVREAAAAGRITALDRDHRIMELQHAASDADIEVHLRDLRHPAAPGSAAGPVAGPAVWTTPTAPGPTSGVASGLTASPVTPPQGTARPPGMTPPRGSGSYGSRGGFPPVVPRRQQAAPRRGLLVGCLVGFAVLMVVPMVATVFLVAVTGSDQDSGTSAEVIEPVPDIVDNHTRAGYQRLVSALRSQTERTDVFSIVIHPEYASLDVPVDETSARYRTWSWNGTMRQTSSASTTTQERVDLADVEPKVLMRLLARAARGVDDPTTRYLIIRGADISGPATVMAYATNEFNESHHVRATLTGEILD